MPLTHQFRDLLPQLLNQFALFNHQRFQLRSSQFPEGVRFGAFRVHPPEVALHRNISKDFCSFKSLSAITLPLNCQTKTR